MKERRKKVIFRDLFAWLVIWSFVFGFFVLGLRGNGVNFIDSPFAVSFYFLIVIGLILGVFRGHLHPYVKKFTRTPFVWLIIMFFASAIIYNVIPMNFSSPPAEIVNNGFLDFTKLQEPFLISKGFEILFQQLMIIILISLLLEMKVKFKHILMIVPVVFLLGHFGFFFLGLFWEGLFYALFALIGIPLFILLIEKVNYGFVYSYILHYSFYVVAGALAWIVL